MTDFKQKLERIRFLIDRLKYKRERHLYLSLILIVFLLSAFTAGSYIYQKREITRKENILKSYFSEINELNNTTQNDAAGPDNSATGMISSDNPESNKEKETRIKVYICGYVHNPGVYEIDSQARIADLLDICGGAKESACLEAVNLAEKLMDGERIYIPSIKEVEDTGIDLSETGLNQSSGTRTELININSASFEELQLLPGIGEQIAKNIIDYREKYGFFKSIEDLKNVNGIGEKKYEQIKELIAI